MTRRVQNVLIALGLTAGATTAAFAATFIWWLTGQPNPFDIFGEEE